MSLIVHELVQALKKASFTSVEDLYSIQIILQDL